jgi:hypothetical protein
VPPVELREAGEYAAGGTVHDGSVALRRKRCRPTSMTTCPTAKSATPKIAAAAINTADAGTRTNTARKSVTFPPSASKVGTEVKAGNDTVRISGSNARRMSPWQAIRRSRSAICGLPSASQCQLSDCVRRSVRCLAVPGPPPVRRGSSRLPAVTAVLALHAIKAGARASRFSRTKSRLIASLFFATRSASARRSPGVTSVQYGASTPSAR